MMTRLDHRLGQQAMQILRGLIAFGSAELAVRLVRLLTVVVIARQLAPDIVGTAALTLTAFELIRVLANIGVGQQIIAAPAAQLDAICNTAHRIFWRWCLGVALVQLGVAAVLAFGFYQPLSAAMLATLSLVYLWMPGGLVNCYLLMREGRAGATARTTATQTIADHLLTALLLLIWQSPWSIVLPKLLTAPIWLVLTRRARPWGPNPAAGNVPARSLLRFGSSVLAADLMQALRTQGDKLIVASTLGISALGTYFFAFNAGIGIVSSLISAFGTVVFPTLCAVPRGRARSQSLRKAIMLGSIIFIPVILAQSGLAEFYVPLVFGANWSHAAPLVGLLCLAGLPMLAAVMATAWLRAEGRPGLDASASTLASVLSLGGLLIGAQSHGLNGAATGWVIGLALGLLPFAVTILARAIRPSLLLPIQEAQS